MGVVSALRIILVILAFNGGLQDRSVFSVFSGVAADSATMEAAMVQC